VYIVTRVTREVGEAVILERIDVAKLESRLEGLETGACITRRHSLGATKHGEGLNGMISTVSDSHAFYIFASNYPRWDSKQACIHSTRATELFGERRAFPGVVMKK
jgi:hypothetical protein